MAEVNQVFISKFSIRDKLTINSSIHETVGYSATPFKPSILKYTLWIKERPATGLDVDHRVRPMNESSSLLADDTEQKAALLTSLPSCY